ncbi:MAG: ABC transporter permease, partial [Nanoarchaeota archaeon]
VTPLTFLGGVFYTLSMVPPLMSTITRLNPIYYMINGTRYGMIGVSDGNVYIGLVFLSVLCVAMFMFVHTLVRRGYHLRT